MSGTDFQCFEMIAREKFLPWIKTRMTVGHGQPPQNVSLFFKMSVNNLLQLILVNSRVLIPNLNVTNTIKHGV